MRWPPWARPEPDRVERLRGTEAAPDLARLHATGFAHPWDAAAFEGLLSEPAVLAHGLRVGGAVAGFALSRQVLDEAELLSVAIDPAARGAGRGGLLLRTHLAGLAGSGVATLHLEVEAGNAPALALYRRLGFREVGRRENYYRLADGRRAAALTMSLALA